MRRTFNFLYLTEGKDKQKSGEHRTRVRSDSYLYNDFLYNDFNVDYYRGK